MWIHSMELKDEHIADLPQRGSSKNPFNGIESHRAEQDEDD